MQDWPSWLGASLGLALPGLAFAVGWGRILSRLNLQDRVLIWLETKLDSLTGDDLAELTAQVTVLGEKLHATRNVQLLVARVDELEAAR